MKGPFDRTDKWIEFLLPDGQTVPVAAPPPIPETSSAGPVHRCDGHCGACIEKVADAQAALLLNR